jgi:peptide/nickel transport system substrate-binding protein
VPGRSTGVIRSRRVLSAVALVAGLALVAAACGGGSDDKSGGDTSTTAGGGAKPAAGTITVGAEQDASCADWVSNCSSSLWGFQMMAWQTMPRVFDYAKQNGIWTEVPNPMMASMPEATTVNGKQTVTYKISPTAVWSDGQPITSNDFKYTWDQIVNGKDIYDPTGYDKVESIDTTDPKTAVVTFKETYASWTAMFSADYGVFPSHLLEGKNRHDLMKNGYDWSGGPWTFTWRKGVDVTLTPNPKWYGQKPTIQKVVFRIITNTASQFEAFKGDQVDAIYPQAEPSAVASIKGGISGTQSVFSADTGNVEALWLNNGKFPFDSSAVRQAFAYAIDRDAIVKRLFGDLGINKAVQTLNPPIVGKYADQQAYANYTLNLNQVNNLMQGDGWKKNGSGVWEKGGKEAAFTMKTTAGNKRRELTEQILQEQMKQAGFKMSIKNPSAEDLFNKVLPAFDYQASLYAQTSTSLNPGLCAIACSKNIPSKANDNTGQNYQKINVPTLDPLLEKVDTDFVQSERIQASKQADQIMAQEQVSLPLDPLPNIAMWNDRLKGPINDNPVLSMFWNMYAWSL